MVLKEEMKHKSVLYCSFAKANQCVCVCVHACVGFPGGPSGK